MPIRNYLIKEKIHNSEASFQDYLIKNYTEEIIDQYTKGKDKVNHVVFYIQSCAVLSKCLESKLPGRLNESLTIAGYSDNQIKFVKEEIFERRSGYELIPTKE